MSSRTTRQGGIARGAVVVFVVVLLMATTVFTAASPARAASGDTTWIDESFDSPSWDASSTWWNWLAGDYIAKTPVAGISGNGTRITMKPGRHDAAMLNYQFARHGFAEPSEAYFRYWLRFEVLPEDTGKLPGFMALYSDSGRAGVVPSETKPGWSARVLFGPGAAGKNVKLGYYLYWLDQATAAGDKVWWSQEVPLGQWACIEGRVAMNTPGTPDGALDAWIDGKQVLARNDIAYRTANQSSVKIREFMFEAFYGGPTTPARDTTVSFDSLVVADHRVGCGGSTPQTSFEDTADSPFVADIEWLAQTGITKGCNPTANTRFCPNQAVTRGQMAAFLHRALGSLVAVPPIPPAPPDPPTMWGVEVADYKAALTTMANAGRPLDVVHVQHPLAGQDWLATGVSSRAQWVPLQLSNITDAGAVPYIEFHHKDISGFNAGRYDREFNAWLDIVVSWLKGDPSRRLLIAPFPEANNQNVSYGDDAPAFKTAYRKVRTAVRSAGIGTSQVRFVYQMSANLDSSRYTIGGVGSGFDAYSPGSANVDVAAIAWLNKGTRTWDDWDSLFKARVAEMSQSLGPDVPIIMGVVGSAPSATGETRAAWLAGLASGIVSTPNVVGFVYLDKQGSIDYRVGTETTPDRELLDAIDAIGPVNDRLAWMFSSLDDWKAKVRASSLVGIFGDDNGSVFESDIAWLARSGITRGCGTDIFCPDKRVTRAQMAAFLHRALGDVLPPSGTPGTFTDVADSPFAADIAWLSSTGITRGCNPPVNDRFCPDTAVTRGQMAAFLHRALKSLIGR